MHPGVGLWSQKIHEFLQPRSHVLLEPSAAKFDEYLKPLLEKPGSKYRLHTGNIGDFETIRSLIDGGAFPDQKRVRPEDPSSRQQNTLLLVTGSLMWDPKLPGIAFDSMAKQLFIQFTKMAVQNDGFHAFGPVRMLLWMDHNDFKGILPRSMNQHNKASFYMDTLAKMTEVVAAGHEPRLAGKVSVGREPQYELESIIRAMRAGKEKGMELPAHRRENVHDFAEDVERMTQGKRVMKSADMYQYLKEQEMAGKSTVGLSSQAAIDSYKVDMVLKENPKMYRMDNLSVKGNHKRVSQEGKQANIIRASISQQTRQKQQIERAADIGEEIYHAECKILGMQDGADKEAALKKLQSLEDDFAAAVGKIPKNLKSAVYSDLDDRQTLYSPVPRLQWDARPFEPLVMQPDEVFPANRVSLVDCEPRPAIEGRTADWFEWVQDFLYGLFQHSSTGSVVSALENMQPGASEIIANAPSLKDPAKGGRLEMKNLRVRMLTPEMVVELCAAYKEWPFRSPNSDHTRYFRLRFGKPPT